MAAGTITVRYWAGAKAAAGTGEDAFAVEGPISLAEVVIRSVGAHPGTRLAEVLAVCSTLVQDRPTASEDAANVQVEPGETVQFLPPFAGG